MNPSTLKRIRELRGLPQTTLALRAGLSVDTIYRLEAGTREPSSSALESIAAALDVPAGIFLGEGWLGLVERMGATIAPDGKRWIASARGERSDVSATGRTPEDAVLTLYTKWSKE